MNLVPNGWLHPLRVRRNAGIGSGYSHDKRPRGQPHGRSGTTCSDMVVPAGHEDCEQSRTELRGCGICHQPRERRDARVSTHGFQNLSH